MNANDLSNLRMCEMCTFPGDFKNDLLKLDIDEELAEDMAYAFRGLHKKEGAFFLFLMAYCLKGDNWTDVILKYINHYQKYTVK